MLDLELFKLDMPFRSALNILRLFLGATALDGVEEWFPFPFPARESFSDWSSLLFFLRFFVKSLIFVNVVPLESWLLLADEGFEGVAATDLLDPCKLFLKIMKFTWNFWLSKDLRLQMDEIAMKCSFCQRAFCRIPLAFQKLKKASLPDLNDKDFSS